jgi:hypothetical protein
MIQNKTEVLNLKTLKTQIPMRYLIIIIKKGFIFSFPQALALLLLAIYARVLGLSHIKTCV